jgi:hypothetical protein
MPDKSRTLFPIPVEFYDGELPSSAKLNGLSKQAKQGLSIVEYALGDIWNQGGDAFLAGLADTRLLIPNIGRYLGSTRYLSPRIPHLPYIQEYTHFVEGGGVREFQLSFPVHSASTFVWAGVANNSTPEISKENVTSAGQWYLNYKTGYIYSINFIPNGTTFTYQPGYFDDEGNEQLGIYGDLGPDTTWNVIPDLFADESYDFRGLKIESTAQADEYIIYLPPRTPLKDERQLDISPPKTHGYNTASFSERDSGSRHFFQDTTSSTASVASIYAEHYRYNLPRALTESANWQSGALLPDGYMYLYDEFGTGTIIEGLKFYAEAATNPRTWKLVVKGANLTTWLSTAQGSSAYTTSRLEATDNHGYLMYPNNGLKLICVGSDISKSISSFTKQYLNHSHNNQGSLPTRMLKHSDLIGNLDPDSDYVGLSLDNDDHLQYLHRDGYTVSRSKNNGMLGPLFISDINGKESTIANSHGIYFGNISFGPNMSWDAINAAFRLNSPSNLSFQAQENAIIGTNDIQNNTARSFSEADSHLEVYAQGLQLGSGNYPLPNNAEPAYISFRVKEDENDSDNIKLGATTNGSLFLRAGGKTGLGEGGTLYSNRYKVGSYDDPNLGYADYPEYGPVRYMNVSPADFKYFETSSLWNSGALTNEYSQFLTYGDNTNDQPIEVVGRIGFYSDVSNSKQHALYYINLPWSDYMIVNVKLSIKYYDINVSRNTFVFGMGKQLTYQQGYSVIEERNASAIFNLTSTSWQNSVNVFNKSGGQYIVRHTQSNADGAATFLDAFTPVFYMRSPVINNSGGGLKFSGMQILYRVREI